MHWATNRKGDSPAFVVSGVTPVVLAWIMKRLTTDGTEFCDDVMVYQCRPNSGSPALCMQLESCTFGRIENRCFIGTNYQQRGMASEQKHVLAVSRVQAWSGNMTASRYPSRHDHSRDSETAGAVSPPCQIASPPDEAAGP